MPSIDGLVTGIDTASVIEGLLNVQRTQIDRLNLPQAIGGGRAGSLQ